MSTEVRNQPVPADHVASTELLKRIDRMRAALRNKIAPRPWQYGQCHLIRDNDSAHEDQRVLRHREVARDAINLIEELMDVIERGWNTAGLYDDAHTWLVSAAESASATLTDAERTKVSSQASGHDRVEPMTPPTLSPTEYAILRNLVVGREVTTIPERLVELGFVRSEKLRSTIGMVKMVWVATRNGRLCIARSEE